MKPVKHKISVSGSGDVVSVDALNRVVDYQMQLASAFTREHSPSRMKEAYGHTTPNWPVASACLDIELLSKEEGYSEAKTIWAEGFKTNPHLIVTEEQMPDDPYSYPPSYDMDGLITTHAIAWELATPAPQTPMLGLGSYGLVAPSREAIEFIQEKDSGSAHIPFAVWSGYWGTQYPEVDFYSSVRRIYLLVWARE